MEKNEKKEKKPYIPPELKTIKITKQANLLCGSGYEECGMSFCTDSDCINEYNTDFRTFNIEEIYD